MHTSNIFRITQIKSNIELDKNLIKEIRNTPLLNLDMKKIYSQIFRSHPEYKEIYISREFPSSLKIEVYKRKPFAQLKARGFYLVDRQGVIISDAVGDSFPNIMVIEIADYNIRLSRASRIRDLRLELAFNLMEELKKKNLFCKLPINLINVTNPQAIYFIIGDTRVVVGRGDFGRKLYILDNLLKEKLKGDLSLVDYIDLRYNKVYLGYKR
jgi:hypothetical protein